MIRWPGCNSIAFPLLNSIVRDAEGIICKTEKESRGYAGIRDHGSEKLAG
jgi:hypothetical protein